MFILLEKMKSILLIIFFARDWDKLEKITFLWNTEEFLWLKSSLLCFTLWLRYAFISTHFYNRKLNHITLKMLNKETSLLVNILKTLVLVELLPKMRNAGVWDLKELLACFLANWANTFLVDSVDSLSVISGWKWT